MNENNTANAQRVPKHLALIVDGNRRWARERGLPASLGHKAGFDNLRDIIRYAVGERGVEVLSMYVFSTENFSRDAKEVDFLMNLFVNNFKADAKEMNERGFKVLFSGRREGLGPRLLEAMDYMIELTKNNDKGMVNFCLNYGSHAELTDGIRALAREVQAGTLAPEDIDEAAIAAHLYQPLPPVDLLVRTSGEQRISNFLLWQISYAELYFTPTQFPDFSRACLDEAFAEYARRDRRMGGDTQKK
ncbi:MAG: polyprenyl diphosphate synthase [Gemmiger sp.]|nr:polyprenyl diphosphate synthase [Gemmiger sp.]